MQRLTVNPDGRDLDAALDAAVTELRAGRLVAFPTETVYGLGARLHDSQAVSRLFEAKGRPDDKPISLLVPDVATARTLAATWPDMAEALGQAFWPGPLTLVVEADPGIELRVRAGGPTIGLRVPAHPVALALLERLGEPLATPSANRSGEPAPTSGLSTMQALSGTPHVTLLLDAGETRVQVASTVVDATGAAPRILRQGVLTEDALREVWS